MKKKNLTLFFAAFTVLLSTSCHKSNNNNNNNNTNPPSSSQIISSFCTNVALATYTDMYNHAIAFQTAEASFYTNPNDNDLNTMRTEWKSFRAAYEQGEAFLIGPISTLNLDPNVDTWPVEYNELDSILISSTPLTANYVDSLQPSLKGFHPVEYLIFGLPSSPATSADFTVTTTTPSGPRKTEYLHALTASMVSVITEIKNSYVVGSSDDFISIIENPSTSNPNYQSNKAALLDIINAMADICNEVGGNQSDGKINSVFITQDDSLQESFFSNNSWTDFKNNITGIKNVYMNTYNGSSSGHSLHELVSAKNLSLDNTITNKLDAAINSFNTVTVPFGQAVQTNGGQRTQVQNVMNAITDLQNVLDDGTIGNNNDLVDFVNINITD